MGPISLAKQLEMFNNNSLKAKTRCTVVRGMNKEKEKPTNTPYVTSFNFELFCFMGSCGVAEKKRTLENSYRKFNVLASLAILSSLGWPVHVHLLWS